MLKRIQSENDRAARIFSGKTLLYFILALALVRGLIYASVVPPWQAPDEPAHFERARASVTAQDWQSNSANPPFWYDDLGDSLFTFRFFNYLFEPIPEIPRMSLREYFALYQEIYGGQYANRATYAVMAWPLFLARYQDITLQLYLVRLNTVLMGAAVIFLAYHLTRKIFPEHDFLIWGVPILILFNPQHTHMVSTVNNGNLAELLVTIVLYLMVVGLVQGFSLLNIMAILFFSLAAMWTKATAYFLFFPLLTIGLFFLWQYRRYWYGFPLLGLLLAGLLYYFAPARLDSIMAKGLSYLAEGGFGLDPIIVWLIFHSFWAMPGWALLWLHSLWYEWLFIACVLALVGLIILLVRRWKLFRVREFQPQIRALAVLAVAVGAAIAIQVGWHILTGTRSYSQGRSLYPVIVPISIFLMLGWRQLIPPGWRKPGLLGITLILFLFDSLVLFNYIIPFFYA